MDFVDFQIELSAAEGSGYRIRAESPYLDPIDAPFDLPYDEPQLTNQLDRIELAVLKGSGRRRSLQTEQLEVVTDFGGALFDATISGQIAEAYYDAYRRATELNNGLRLTISADPPEVARLPWEFLFDTRRRRFVALSSSTPLVRHLRTDNPLSVLPVSGALRVLGMVSSPPALGELDTEAEKLRMSDALAPLAKRGMLQLRWVEGGTWRDLRSAMHDGPWHVFHFIGHGQFDRTRDEGVLAFEPEGAESYRPINPAEMDLLIEGDHSLRLVVLNACEGARGNEHDALSSMAAYLARGSAPAVLAMQWEISDASAIEFSRTFYEVVARGEAVDAAVAEARLAMSLAVQDSLEWATPVIYMRTPDGRVFDIERPRPEDLVTLAQRAVNDQDWDLAVGLLTELFDQEPDDPRGVALRDELARRRNAAALYDRAAMLFESDDWEGVLGVFNEIDALGTATQDPRELRKRAAAELASATEDQDDHPLPTDQVRQEIAPQRMSFRTSRLAPWLVAELTLTGNQLHGTAPNTFLGYIPTGQQTFTYRLPNIAQVSVMTRFRPLRFFVGVAMLAGFALAVAQVQVWGGGESLSVVAVLVLGVMLLIGGFQARLTIGDSGGGRRNIPVRWRERSRVKEFAAAIRENLGQ